MAKSREGKDTEFYKSIIRQLKKENKTLRKQLNRNTKEIDIEDIIDDVQELEDYPTKCSKCNHGFLEEFEVASRQFSRCTSCGYRSPGRKING